MSLGLIEVLTVLVVIGLGALLFIWWRKRKQ